jgi:dolichyl-phosphate-mannose-protein mannosyltransferase
VDPPLGKWIIGLGSQIFGYNAFGWRIMPAVFGTLAILLLVRVTRLMFRSTILGCAAGLLMTLDGMEFVLSRTVLLDIFLTDVLRFRGVRLPRHGSRPATAAVAAGDRERSRPDGSWAGRRTHAASRVDAIPWWRLARAAMAGCALAVKWSALWYVTLFVILIIVWEIDARRTVGAAHPVVDTLLDETKWLVACTAIVLVDYTASWSGRLATSHGYDRHGVFSNLVIAALRRLEGRGWRPRSRSRGWDSSGVW